MSSMLTFEDAIDLPLDPLSTLTMLYTEDGFEELKKDIKQRGQLVPITLRDGKILDGRHRHRACIELGLGVSYEEVGRISYEEALDFVISRSINKATGTDASKVEAYLLCKAKGTKVKEMPNIFRRLNINYARKLSYIEKEDPRYLQVLLNQNKVRLYNKTFDKIENYGTIHGIWQTIKCNNAAADKIIEVSPVCDDTPSYEIDISSVMVNEVAENAYWELYNLGNDYGMTQHPGSPYGKRVIEMLNELYKTVED